MAGSFFHLLAVSAVVMVVAHTVSRERLFARIRERLGGKETWCGYLVCCTYCLSHWVALAIVPLTGAYYLVVPYDWGIVGRILTWILSSLLVVAIAAFFRVVFYFVDETQGLVKRAQRKVEEEADLISTQKVMDEDSPAHPASRH